MATVGAGDSQIKPGKHYKPTQHMVTSLGQELQGLVLDTGQQQAEATDRLGFASQGQTDWAKQR